MSNETTKQEPPKCNQHDCTEIAVARYTWPGRPEELACLAHVNSLNRIAMSMGFFLQLRPVGGER